MQTLIVVISSTVKASTAFEDYLHYQTVILKKYRAYLGSLVTNRLVYICCPVAQGAKERAITVFDAGIYDNKQSC
jgi:hypothetical protein